MKNKLKFFSYPTILFALFVLFTLLVKFFDVSTAGESNTDVGFSSINSFFFDLFKNNSFSNFWYKLSECLGYFALLTPVVFACIGFCQLLKNKKISLIDKRLFLLAFFYVIVFFFYLIFEIIVINYRPILIDGSLEASYPSSHTILSVCLLGSSVMYFKRFISSNKILNYIYSIVACAFIIAILAGRILSSMHWFTDVFGGVILSVSLLLYLKSFLSIIEKE